MLFRGTQPVAILAQQTKQCVISAHPAETMVLTSREGKMARCLADDLCRHEHNGDDKREEIA